MKNKPMVQKIIKKIIVDRVIPKRSSFDYPFILFIITLASLKDPIIPPVDKNNALSDLKGKKMTGENVLEAFARSFKIDNDNKERGLSLVEVAFDSLRHLRLKLIVNKTKIAFITSDNPVVKYNQYLEKRLTNDCITGYGVKGLQFFYPISPNEMFLLYDDLIYDAGNSKESVIEINDESEINQLNLLQFLNCNNVLLFNHSISERKMKKYQADSMLFDKPNQKRKIKAEIKKKLSDIDPTGLLSGLSHTSSKVNLELAAITETLSAQKNKLDVKKVVHFNDLNPVFIDMII